jgi:hypothetical protein
MSGGITQLISIGAQDKFITGNPEVSFFVSNYKRHTNFSQVTDSLVLSGNPYPGGLSSVRLDRKGDLVNHMFFTVSDGTQALKKDWSNIIDKVELLIGGQIIDTQDFTFTNDLAVDLFAQNLSKSFYGHHYSGGISENWFYPLRFFCCENSKTSLPLVSLQFHDVDVRITWSKNYDINNIIKFHANYIYLDNSERFKFSSKPHTLLIYQVQKTIASNETIQELFFNHPIKFIAAKSGGACTSNTCQIVMQINGVEIAEKKYAKPHFTIIPSYYTAPYSVGNTDNFFLYPFCFDTSSSQPCGTLNFSRLDSARLISDNSEKFTTDFYAVNYNILEIKEGMGGLLYSD